MADPEIRAALAPDNSIRLAAIRAQELDRAQVLASRNVGRRIVNGEIAVTLKHIRL